MLDPHWMRWLLILALGAPAAVAHDMWIAPPGIPPSGVPPSGVPPSGIPPSGVPPSGVPPSGVPPSGGGPVAVGELVEVRLRVGHGGHDEPVPRDPRRLARLVAVGPGGEQAVLGLDGSDPVGFFRPREAGTWALVYESTAAYSELPAARFERYLAEEGLEHVARLRRESGETDEPGRELYSRSLKSLFQVGGSPATGDRPIGLPLELVLVTDPVRRVGEPAELRLLLRGEPLSGALVDVRRLDRDASAVARRTDGDGRARFELGPGAWLAAVVHMEAAPASSKAAWQTLFATLTFVVPETPPAGR